MKSLKFTAESFGLDDYYNKPDSYVQLTSCEAADTANRIFHLWMTRFLAEMQSYAQGMSVLSEEPFKEFMKDFCEEWRVRE